MSKELGVLGITRRPHEPCPFPVELLGHVVTTSSSVELLVKKNAVIVLTAGLASTYKGQPDDDVPVVPIGLNHKVVPGPHLEGFLEQHHLLCSSSISKK